jgi:hypothetical protein
MESSHRCHDCGKPTLGQRFCPGCGTLQKESTIQGVAAATVPVKGAAKGGPKGAKAGAVGVVPPKAQTITKEELRFLDFFFFFFFFFLFCDFYWPTSCCLGGDSDVPSNTHL